MAIAETTHRDDDGITAQWPELCKRIAKRRGRRHLASLWSEIDPAGNSLRWGVESALGELPSILVTLSEISGSGQLREPDSLSSAIEQFLDTIGRTPLDRKQIPEAIAWAYAMPTLALEGHPWIGEQVWWNLLEELQALHRAAHSELSPSNPERLILAGEMGAVLAWTLADLPSCEALKKPSLEAIHDWYAASGDAVAEAIHAGARYARLILASALRGRRLASGLKSRIGVRRCGAAIDLTAWVVAMTRKSGSPMLAPETPCRDDLGPKGLIEVAANELGAAHLRAAAQASLGKIKGECGLSWQVELPEPGWFDDDAKTAVMLPDWDIRRGRIAVDYSGEAVTLEISGGKRPLIRGDWVPDIRIDGETLQPQGVWNDLCWYTDDEVHYLELERSYGQGVKLQRQILLLRDDLCFLLADAVLGPENGEIQYQSRIPLHSSMMVEEERDTQEFWIRDDRRRALVLPIALGEWRVGPSVGQVKFVDQQSRVSVSGRGRSKTQQTVASAALDTKGLAIEYQSQGTTNLFCPLWFDLSRPRLRSERTWRQLTVAEKLRIVDRKEAVAFRIHVGGDQWVLYRSLHGPANRTFIGKNLISEFFCGRFDATEGTIEELIAVDEQPD